VPLCPRIIVAIDICVSFVICVKKFFPLADRLPVLIATHDSAALSVLVTAFMCSSVGQCFLVSGGGAKESQP
jgi:hypothetical protein